MARLKQKYATEVVPEMIKRFGYKNVMQVPKLSKIVVNAGVGEAVANARMLDSATKEITIVTGQKPKIRRAKKSISNFKLRAGMPVGTAVTLRRERMYEFLDRLITVAMPRIRDFRGIPPKSFDGRGNFAMGVKEQIIFPEIDYDKVEKIRGFDIIIVTTAGTDEEGLELLKLLGMPFRVN